MIIQLPSSQPNKGLIAPSHPCFLRPGIANGGEFYNRPPGTAAWLLSQNNSAAELPLLIVSMSSLTIRNSNVSSPAFVVRCMPAALQYYNK